MLTSIQGNILQMVEYAFLVVNHPLVSEGYEMSQSPYIPLFFRKVTVSSLFIYFEVIISSFRVFSFLRQCVLV